MRLTLEDLQKYDACSDGIEWFKENYSAGLDLDTCNIESIPQWCLVWAVGCIISVTETALRLGFDVNKQDKYCNTALHWASMNGHTDIAKLLLDSGADVNTQNKYYNTPLHLSSINGYTSIVKLLLDSGADVNTQNNLCYTVLHYASMNGHTSTAKLLLDSGADVNKQNKYNIKR